MKNPIIVITLILTSLLVSTSFAQSVKPEKKADEKLSFHKGQVNINMGIGLISFPTMGVYTTSSSVPLQGSIDVGISKYFAVGVNYGRVTMTSHILPLAAPRNKAYWTGRENWQNFDKTVTNVSLRFTGHYAKMEKIDLYGGVMLGTKLEDIVSKEEDVDVNDYFESENGKFQLSGIIGMRYHFNNNLGAFGELGYGVALLSFGISQRF